MIPLKVAVVTGARSEYGLLFWILKELQQNPEFELQLIVTGAHLKKELGFTVQTIENPLEIKNLRRQLAKLKTILNEKKQD